MGDYHDDQWLLSHTIPVEGPSVHDDGRILNPVLLKEYCLVGVLGGSPYFAAPRGSRQVFLFRGQKLLADTIDIHSTDHFDVTKWESMYSSVLTLGNSPFSNASFAPVIDENYRIVGHLGWADGSDILVPEVTVRNSRQFWSSLKKQRLDAFRQWLLDDADRWDRGPFPNSPFRRQSAPTSPPSPKPAICGYHPPSISLKPTLWEQARRGPLPENTEEVATTYLTNLVEFLKGGGTARVGRHFQERDQGFYLSPHPHPIDGSIGSPKKPFSSGYEFLVLVDPEGNLQGVMDIRNNLKTEDEWVTEKALEVLDIADKVMTVLMVIEVAPLAVVLLRAGVTIAKGAAIQAIRLVLDAAAKAALKRLLEQEARRVAEIASREAIDATARMEVSGLDSEFETIPKEELAKVWGGGPPRRLTPDQLDRAIELLRNGKDVHVESIEQMRQIQAELGQLGVRSESSSSIIPQRPPVNKAGERELEESYKDGAGTYRVDDAHKFDEAGTKAAEEDPYSAHKEYPHINIRLRNGKKLAVIITGSKSF